MTRALKRWWWIFIAIPAVIGLARLRLDVDVLNLLPADEPGVRGLKLYQEHFSNARELLLTLRFPNADNSEGLAGELAAALRRETNLVASVSWQPPWMEQPAQAAEMVAYLWFNHPPEVFGALTNRLASAQLQATLAEAKETLATSLSPMDIARRAFDPYDLLTVPQSASFNSLSPEQGEHMFASADGKFRVIFVQANHDLQTWRDCADWLAATRSTIEAFRAGKPEWQGVVIQATGRPAFVAEIAASMRRDMTGSVIGTAVIIALLFWLTHRRWLPMLWLLLLLALILAATMGIGSLLLGTVNVISLGFAAVLLGLAVDYAVVHYQEALAHPQLSVPEIRRAIAPSILWAAITTIAAFLVLNFGGLPGLAQLGSLVAVGVALAAVVMVVAFLPPLFPERRREKPQTTRPKWWTFLFPPIPPPASSDALSPQSSARTALWLTLTIGVLAVVMLLLKPPGMDRTGDALRVQNIEAETALKEITAAVGIPQDPLWVIADGKSELQVRQKLSEAESLLSEAHSKGWIANFTLPTQLWPQTEWQQQNRATAAWLSQQGASLANAAVREGFNTNALALTGELLRDWGNFGASRETVWPTNHTSQWLLQRFVAHSTNEWFGLGLVYPATNHLDAESLPALSEMFEREGISLSGWPLLGGETLQRVNQRLWPMVIAMVALVLLSLWLAFRSFVDVALGIGVLLLSGLCLLTVMGLAGWSWNLLNLMGVPLILGTGVDYGIFIQLGLRRMNGDARAVRRSIGRALLLCGGTAVTGFGSLAFSGNAGMASLGKVCAVGIAANVVISIFLLPSWWLAARGQSASAAPSTLYRAGVWRGALAVTRWMPEFLLQKLALLLATVYQLLNKDRREIVFQNLLPALSYDREAASKTASHLYRQFALKLLDLWNYENGRPAPIEVRNEHVFAQLQAAHQRGQGVLLVTPHLGNWEIGGQLMKDRGIPLLAITQAEPGPGFTELRSASRARWGIETLTIGQDAFAFVEVIRRLQEGALVALLMDRPAPASAVIVELFGREFPASIAAAELARASGCAIFCASITRGREKYVANLMTGIDYDRRALGNREARRELTQQIMKIFEPEIRDHLDQWFHFVPIWPEQMASMPATEAAKLSSA